MSMYAILICNFLLVMGYCGDINECLAVTGKPREMAHSVISKAIQSFSRDLMLLGGKGRSNLYVGVRCVPFKKQSSLRLLKQHVDTTDVVRAVVRMWGVLHDTLPVSIRDANMDDDEMWRIFTIIQPMFTLLGREFTREELVAKYHELLASSGDSNTAVNMAIDADVEDMFPSIQGGLEPLGPVLK